MRLIEFRTVDSVIAINPDHVVTVRPHGVDYTWIAFSQASSHYDVKPFVVVRETYEHVCDALSGVNFMRVRS